MIKDPRNYTNEYPQSNMVINHAIDVLHQRSSLDELACSLNQILKNENDALINVALNLSPSFAVSSIIWRALNAAINDVGDVKAHIFAVPLVLVAGSKVKTKLNGSLNVDKLNEFFLQQKIFEDDTDSFISAKLIDPSALARIRPSQLYYWSRNLMNAKLGLPVPLEGAEVGVFNEGVFLRFLVGLTIGSKHLGINQAKYTHSSMLFMKLINEELKNDSVTLFPIPFSPLNFSEAYPVGNNKRTEIAITVALSNIVRKIREQRLTPFASLSGENEAIKVHIFCNDEELSETSLWHLNKFEDYQEHVITLTNLLTQMQVEYSYAG